MTVIVTLIDTGAVYTVGLPDSATITILNFSEGVFMDGFED